MNIFHCFPRNYATIVYFCPLATFGLHHITLHYIGTSFHTPITLTVINGASTKSFKFSKCELKKMSFQKFFESISVCEFLEIGRKGIPCFRSGERETALAELWFQPWKFMHGSCWRISISHDQAGQRRMSSYPTGTEGCDQLAPGA